MRTTSLLLGGLALGALVIFACNGETLVVADRSDAGGGSSEASTGTSSSGGSSSFGSSNGGPSDGGPGTCCPLPGVGLEVANPGLMPSGGCMNLGGSSKNGCAQTCFSCATSWRVEKVDGCDVWRYDVRQPQASENAQCLPVVDGGATGCSPACNANTEICERDSVTGGAQFFPDDAGACPPGRHLVGGACELAPTFKCVARPAACGAAPSPVDCNCAGTLCTSTNRQCEGAQGAEVDCLLLAP
jgi:hypothetical protein